MQARMVPAKQPKEGTMAKTTAAKKVAAAPEKQTITKDDIGKLPEVHKSSLPANAAAFDTRDTGFENVGASDLLIPRLTILQGLSPQVNKAKPEYDEDARVGNIYDVGLQQNFGDSLHILPVHYTKVWLEWAPRSTGKGLVQMHETNEILQQTKEDQNGRDVLANGNYITETAQFFVLNLDANARKSFIPMASTQLKKARRLLTLAMSEEVERPDGTTFTPPIYYRTYRLGTVPESNAEGSWVGWKVERDKALSELPGWEKLLETAKLFRAALTAGKIKGDMRDVESEHPAQRAHNAQGAPL
jgi:hypothetical protein